MRARSSQAQGRQRPDWSTDCSRARLTTTTERNRNERQRCSYPHGCYRRPFRRDARRNRKAMLPRLIRLLAHLNLMMFCPARGPSSTQHGESQTGPCMSVDMAGKQTRVVRFSSLSGPVATGDSHSRSKCATRTETRNGGKLLVHSGGPRPDGAGFACRGGSRGSLRGRLVREHDAVRGRNGACAGYRLRGACHHRRPARPGRGGGRSVHLPRCGPPPPPPCHPHLCV